VQQNYLLESKASALYAGTYPMKKQTRSNCPISYSLEVFGDKWTLLILRDLLVRKKRYYQDFLNSDEGIATNILADRLKALLDNGLVTKTDNPDNRRQTIYSPTKKAIALLPVLGEMAKWGLMFGERAKDRSLKALMNNYEGFRKEVRGVYKKELEELEKG
jgi:DNA-binding HxlR family transcriptional regulator